MRRYTLLAVMLITAVPAWHANAARQQLLCGPNPCIYEPLGDPVSNDKAIINQNFSQVPFTVGTPQLGQVPVYGATGNNVQATNGSGVLVIPSGDTTGATDPGAWNAALTAARVAGGGTVRCVAGSSYYINSKLIIGSFTTLDMTGCRITLVAGANGSMLQNYAMQAPIATGAVVLNAGSTAAYAPSYATNPIWTAIMASNAALAAAGNHPSFVPGLTLNIGMQFGVYTQYFVSDLTSNYYAANGNFILELPAYAAANATASLYQRDMGIRIIGGIWDRGVNGTSVVADETHNIMIRYADDVLVQEVTSVGETPTDGTFLYAIFGQSVSAMTVRDAHMGANPEILVWSVVGFSTGPYGYGKDGVHIAGPAKDIVIDGVTGATGDNLVVVSGGDLANMSGNIIGPTDWVDIRSVHGYSTQCLVAVYTGYGTYANNISIHDVHGWNSGGSGLINIADYPNSVASNGTYDNILVDGLWGNSAGSTANGLPLVYMAGSLGRIKLRDLRFANASSTAPGIINIGAVQSEATTISELTVDDLMLNGTGSSKILYDNGFATITNLKESHQLIWVVSAIRGLDRAPVGVHGPLVDGPHLRCVLAHAIAPRTRDILRSEESVTPPAKDQSGHANSSAAACRSRLPVISSIVLKEDR